MNVHNEYFKEKSIINYRECLNINYHYIHYILNVFMLKMIHIIDYTRLKPIFFSFIERDLCCSIYLISSFIKAINFNKIIVVLIHFEILQTIFYNVTKYS